MLLQVKTLLDNADGQLARASGRVTLAGRYLDTDRRSRRERRAVRRARLRHRTSRSLAAAAFVALTLVLAVDFNVTELYRESHGIPTPQPPATGGQASSACSQPSTARSFAPLDRVVRVVRRRGASTAGGSYDSLTVTVLANLGLTTQLAVLGVCLVLGAPGAYLWFVLACLVALVPLQRRAERRARAALAA